MSDLAKRNKANRAKGDQWERDLREGLRAEGFDVESLRQAGAKDEGDMVVRTGSRLPWRLIVEAKNEKTIDLSGYMREAVTERDNFCAARRDGTFSTLPVAIVKRRNHNWKDAYVVTTVREFFGLWEER